MQMERAYYAGANDAQSISNEFLFSANVEFENTRTMKMADYRFRNDISQGRTYHRHVSNCVFIRNDLFMVQPSLLT